MNDARSHLVTVTSAAGIAGDVAAVGVGLAVLYAGAAELAAYARARHRRQRLKAG